MLNIWKHPKTQAVRLYVAPKLIKAAIAVAGEQWKPKTVKAWLQEGGDHWSLEISVRSDDAISQESVDALKSALLEQATLTGAEVWSDLVAIAESNELPGKIKVASTPSEPLAGNPSGASGAAARAKESGRLDISKIKMPGNITIEVDHRETKLISELLSKHPNITVSRVALELADFRIEDREGNELLIERKRCQRTEASPDAHTDFESSIIVDGRLFDQSERLKFKAANSDHQVIPIILLEGDVHSNSHSMLIQQIDGAISFLGVVQKISVLSSYGANHSAWMVAKLASHFVDGLFTPVARHKSKPKALWNQKLYVLESLPGVSSGIAESLLERFGSVRAAAEERDLASVKGIGPKRSREIVRVLGEL